MKEILTSPKFLVRIDENGKEVEKPEFKGDNRMSRVFNYTHQIGKYSEATEVTKLPTLSDFMSCLEDNEPFYKVGHQLSQVWNDSENWIKSNEYRLFLQQPLTKEMFIGEDAIFVGWSIRVENDIQLQVQNVCGCIINLLMHTTIEQISNCNTTLYLNPDKI